MWKIEETQQNSQGQGIQARRWAERLANLRNISTQELQLQGLMRLRVLRFGNVILTLSHLHRCR